MLLGLERKVEEYCASCGEWDADLLSCRMCDEFTCGDCIWDVCPSCKGSEEFEEWVNDD